MYILHMYVQMYVCIKTHIVCAFVIVSVSVSVPHTCIPYIAFGI